MNMDTQQEAYREEARELLADLEEALLELEQNPGDSELVGRVFRDMHTIKGSGAMFGFNDIAEFTHHIETAYDRVREGLLAVTPDMISLTLRSCDKIRTMVEATVGGEPHDAARAAELVAAFGRMAGIIPPAAEVVTAPATPAAGEERTWRISFKPHRDLFANGTNPLPLLEELRGLGTSRVNIHTGAIPDVDEIDPEQCYVSWDIILTTALDENALQDVFIFVDDLADIEITLIDEPSTDPAEQDYKRLGEILLEKGDVERETLARAVGGQKRLGEIMVEEGAASPAAVRSALSEQEHMRQVKQQRRAQESASSVRVASEKLDALVDLVGELVIVQARLSQESARRDDSDMVLIAEEVERLTAELRDNAMSIRMLPIGTTFARFKRLVRDLSRELGKEVRFETEGAETELDKTVIEKLGDPLVHLIRNSIDHGVELPEERRRRGKTPEGTIHLSARHAGASVLITITDDGKGLDREAIRTRGIERGLITRDAVLSDKELLDLILAPGFSTAAKVTNVSGRGVGMDVVCRSIETLGGSVELKSEEGQGTTVVLKLPLTLAIIDGLLVEIAGDHFVLPLQAVVECIELTREDVEHAHGRHVARVREELVPYIPLRETFGFVDEPPSVQQIVIVETGDRQVGFCVDRVIGQHQTVIKNMGKVLKDIEGVSGATIMGDGSVALILDVNKLVQQAETLELELVG